MITKIHLYSEIKYITYSPKLKNKTFYKICMKNILNIKKVIYTLVSIVIFV